MSYFLACLCGVLIAVMVAINGALTAFHGVYTSTVIIHLVGLALISSIVLFGKKALKPDKKLPLYMFCGGVIGVLTTVSNNVSFGKISISALLALGLFGQGVTSLIYDQIGVLGMKKEPFAPRKLIGLTFVLAGICVMVMPISSGAIVAILASFSAGVTTVVSRTVNAGLSEAGSVFQSTFYNYLLGTITCVAVWFFLSGGEPQIAQVGFSPKLIIYTGGLLGVVIVCLFNYTVSKIPSFYMTLLTFVGQVLTGLVIDIWLTQSFSSANLIGGTLVSIGLSLDIFLDVKARKSASAQ